MDKVIGGTAKSGPNLCESCAQALVVKCYSGQVRAIHCTWLGGKIHFPVYSCSKYAHGNSTDLSEMKKIAWIVESRNRGTWGFKGNGDNEERTDIVVRPPNGNPDVPL